ncbi:MAG: TIGR03809 family protein [Alphaproteobacteria bacterium]|nr:TIGR03809 family protein [Alphaproteobacteria bacterium]
MVVARPSDVARFDPDSFMSYWLSSHALEIAAQKWRALAERRRAHFVELYHSGRWKRYYSEEQFLLRLREAIQVSERWAEIAPSPPRLSVREGAPITDCAAESEPVRTAA